MWPSFKRREPTFAQRHWPTNPARLCLRAVIALMSLHLASSTECIADSTIVQIVTDSKPSIVTIRTYDDNKQQKGIATGFFIAGDEIVTNNHVVSDAPYILITDLTGRKFTFNGTVAANANTDLAVLSVGTTAHPYLQLCRSPGVEGQSILVIGNPEGLQGTVTTGIISAIRSSKSLLQISAPISPGSSGSPVLDGDSGDVIGVVVSFYKEGQNLNFAIPSRQITELLADASSKAYSFSPGDSDDSRASALTPAQEQISTLINSYMIGTQNGMPRSLSSYCTARLSEWYGERNLSIDDAQRSMFDYYRKFPNQTTQYNSRDIHVEAIKGETNSYLAWLDFNWIASNDKTSKSGRSQIVAMVVLTTNGYGYRICAIKSKPLDSGK
jgi:V8-like Glu-specific endopeptidase